MILLERKEAAALVALSSALTMSFSLLAIYFSISILDYFEMASDLTHRLTLSSNAAIFSSCSVFRGFGFSIAGGFGTSSLENQSENSDLEPESFKS